jgi:lysophospholipase-3
MGQAPSVPLDLSSFKPLSVNTPITPVILIPGVGGSQLSGFISNERSAPWYCHTSKSWYLIWLALSQLTEPALSCWSANMALNYSATTGTFSNATGVEIMVNDFGNTSGIEYLDPSVKAETVYYGNLVKAFVKAGYVKGQNLLGAPYDWRLPPMYLPIYFEALQQLIEEAYAVNQTKVAVISHSLGNNFFLSFLRTMTQTWKDTYLQTYFATAPPILGAFTAVQSITSGYNFGIPFLSPAVAKVVQRTFLSTYFLLPYPKYYQSQVLISIPGRNYSSLDYNDMFQALGVSNMYKPYTLSFDTTQPYEPPGVDTYCLYGYNVSTAVQEKYTDTTFTKPTIINGDGDGTVPIESLTFCKTWADQTEKLLIVKGYKGQDHVGLLSYAPFLQDILNILSNSSVLL